jgi:glycosyltransferase involved in cell wall biosynthesis
MKKKLLFLVRKGLDAFLDDLVAALAAEYEVRKEVITDVHQIAPLMQWADLCWFEWCDQLLVHASQLPLAREKPIVCRLHRYEVFTDYPRLVRWEVVDTLMVVADHLRVLLAQSVPSLAARTRVETVPNGVVLDRFPFHVRKPGYHLASVGYLHPRKNPTFLLQILAKLLRQDRRYRLSVAGEFQDALLQRFWEHQVQVMGLAKHVRFDGWQDDVAAWLADKDYLVSPSLHESFGYSIAEAMCMGIKPVVQHFLYATDIWPQEMLFNTIDEAATMIQSKRYDSAAYRQFIADHYSFAQQVVRTREVLAALPGSEKDTRPLILRPGVLRQMVAAV